MEKIPMNGVRHWPAAAAGKTKGRSVSATSLIDRTAPSGNSVVVVSGVFEDGYRKFAAVYSRDAGSWSEPAILFPDNDNEHTEFGQSGIAVRGDVIVVSSAADGYDSVGAAFVSLCVMMLLALAVLPVLLAMGMMLRMPESAMWLLRSGINEVRKMMNNLHQSRYRSCP